MKKGIIIQSLIASMFFLGFMAFGRVSSVNATTCQGGCPAGSTCNTTYGECISNGTTTQSGNTSSGKSGSSSPTANSGIGANNSQSVGGYIMPDGFVVAVNSLNSYPTDQTLPYVTGGYTIGQVLNTKATANSNVAGAYCTSGSCPQETDTNVAGYYIAPNGKYYPVGTTPPATTKGKATPMPIPPPICQSGSPPRTTPYFKINNCTLSSITSIPTLAACLFYGTNVTLNVKTTSNTTTVSFANAPNATTDCTTIPDSQFSAAQPYTLPNASYPWTLAQSTGTREVCARLSNGSTASKCAAYISSQPPQCKQMQELLGPNWIDVTHNLSAIELGDQVEFLVSYSDPGNQPISTIDLQVTLPDGTTVTPAPKVSASPGTGTYTGSVVGTYTYTFNQAGPFNIAVTGIN